MGRTYGERNKSSGALYYTLLYIPAICMSYNNLKAILALITL